MTTVEEAKKVRTLIKKADSIKIDYDNLPAADLNVYLNKEIKSGQFVNNPKVSFEAFQKWYQINRIDKRVEKLKSEKGRIKAIAAGQEQMKMFQRRRQDIINLFRISKLLSEAKLIFVKKYNNAIYNTKHFVDDGKGGLRVTAPEGYVAVEVAFGKVGAMPTGQIAYAVTTYASEDVPGHIVSTIETPEAIDLFQKQNYQIDTDLSCQSECGSTTYEKEEAHTVSLSLHCLQYLSARKSLSQFTLVR